MAKPEGVALAERLAECWAVVDEVLERWTGPYMHEFEHVRCWIEQAALIDDDLAELGYVVVR